MDHEEAVRLQAAVKYVLGELPEVERDSFEEHYFDCGECALDVRAAAAFADNARNVLGHEAREAALHAAAPASRRWLAWFKPIVAVPAFAALLIVVAYQNVVTIPRVKEVAARGSGQIFVSSFSFPKTNTRGGEVRSGEEADGEEATEKQELKVQVDANESFALDFDFNPKRTFESYVCQLQEESGRSLLQLGLPGTSKNEEVHVVVPGGLLRPGKYSLVVLGASSDKRSRA